MNEQNIPTKTYDMPWIYADNKKTKIEEEELSDEEIFRLLGEAQQQRKERNENLGKIVGDKKDKIQRIDENGKKIIVPLCEEMIDKIAIETNYKSGKWMIFSSENEIDEVWNRIAQAVSNNNLDSCESAKASTKEQGKDTYVICVYTNNYLDEQDVMNVREKLRELGITQTLYYKPDIYTHFGIYAKNPYVKASKYRG